jgi:hypothetical protein
MIFYTRNSAYEVDTTNKQIRRLNGKGDPTPRQGKDGEYRKYASLFPDPIEVDQSVVIVWTQETELLPETKAELEQDGGFAIPMTTTSPVFNIVDDTELS